MTDARTVGDLEALWAHAAGVRFSEVPEPTRQRSLSSGAGDSA